MKIMKNNEKDSIAVIILSDDDVEIANDDYEVKDVNASFSKTVISEPLINNSSRKRTIITSSDDDVEVTNDDYVVKDHDTVFA